jgi:hypothetical protein
MNANYDAFSVYSAPMAETVPAQARSHKSAYYLLLRKMKDGVFICVNSRPLAVPLQHNPLPFQPCMFEIQ